MKYWHLSQCWAIMCTFISVGFIILCSRICDSQCGLGSHQAKGRLGLEQCCCGLTRKGYYGSLQVLQALTFSSWVDCNVLLHDLCQEVSCSYKYKEYCNSGNSIIDNICLVIEDTHWIGPSYACSKIICPWKDTQLRAQFLLTVKNSNPLFI